MRKLSGHLNLGAAAAVAALLVASGAQATDAVTNGSFLDGFNDWSTFTVGPQLCNPTCSPNGFLGFTNDVTPSASFPPDFTQNAAQFRVGQRSFDPNHSGGGGISQVVTTTDNPMVFSADVAVREEGSNANSDGGVFTVLWDGVAETSFNFGQVNTGDGVTDRLTFQTVATAGQHTLEIDMTRSHLSADGIFQGPNQVYTPLQYITNVSALQPTATSPGNPLLPNGETFTFVTAAGPVTYIDPAAATGYDYLLDPGSPLIATAVFPTVPGDADGYDVYALTDPSTPLFSNVMGGTTIDFTGLAGYASGIDGFELRGIDLGAGLDPSDPTAFVTGLSFVSPGLVNMSQVPLVTNTAGVPEPSSWAMLILGLAGLGGLMRARQRSGNITFPHMQGSRS